MSRLCKIVFILAGISVANLGFTDQIQPLLDVGAARQVAEKTSQSKIDEMDEQTSVIVSEFKTVSKQIEGLSPKLKRSLIKQMREDFYSLKTICQTDKRYKNIFKY